MQTLPHTPSSAVAVRIPPLAQLGVIERDELPQTGRLGTRTIVLPFRAADSYLATYIALRTSISTRISPTTLL